MVRKDGIAQMGGRDNHSTGSFYTPLRITDHSSSMSIGTRALELYQGLVDSDHRSVEDIMERAPIPELRTFYEDVIKEIRVLDPSCGDGAFLRSCAQYLSSLRSACLGSLIRKGCHDRFLREDLALYENNQLLQSVLDENIFGVDIEPKAVRDCRRSLIGLSAKFGPRAKARRSVQRNIKLGNSLLGFVSVPSGTLVGDLDPTSDGREQDRKRLDEMYLSVISKDYPGQDLGKFEEEPLFHWGIEFPEVMERGGFDVIIGNPPYGDRALTNAQRAAIKADRAFRTTITDHDGKGSLNPSSVFIERCHSLLAKGGQLALILPSSITRVKEFEKIRRFIMGNIPPWQIVDEGSPFKGVTLEMFSIFSKKGTPRRDATIDISVRQGGRSTARTWSIPLTVFSKYDRFMLYWDPTFDRVSKDCKVGQLIGRRGPTIPGHSYTDRKDDAHPIPLLVSGRCVQRYRMDPSRFNWANEVVPLTPKMRSILDSRLLIGARLKNRYRVCIKPPGFLVGDNVICLEYGGRSMTQEALCLILNSKFMQHVTQRYLFNNSQLTMFIQSVTGATPIKEPEQPDLFTRLGEMMLKLGANWPEKARILSKMDALVVDPLVYELYLHDGKSGLANGLHELMKDLGQMEPGVLMRSMEGDQAIMEVLGSIRSDPLVKDIEHRL